MKINFNSLFESVDRISLRFCFNEIKLVSYHENLIGESTENLGRNLKAKCFANWMKFTTKCKEEAQKALKVQNLREKNRKRKFLYSWQNLHWANLLVTDQIFRICLMNC